MSDHEWIEMLICLNWCSCVIMDELVHCGLLYSVDDRLIDYEIASTVDNRCDFGKLLMIFV